MCDLTFEALVLRSQTMVQLISLQGKLIRLRKFFNIEINAANVEGRHNIVCKGLLLRIRETEI